MSKTKEKKKVEEKSDERYRVSQSILMSVEGVTIDPEELVDIFNKFKVSILNIMRPEIRLDFIGSPGVVKVEEKEKS